MKNKKVKKQEYVVRGDGTQQQDRRRHLNNTNDDDNDHDDDDDAGCDEEGGNGGGGGKIDIENDIDNDKDLMEEEVDQADNDNNNSNNTEDHDHDERMALLETRLVSVEQLCGIPNPTASRSEKIKSMIIFQVYHKLLLFGTNAALPIAILVLACNVAFVIGFSIHNMRNGCIPNISLIDGDLPAVVNQLTFREHGNVFICTSSYYNNNNNNNNNDPVVSIINDQDNESFGVNSTNNVTTTTTASSSSCPSRW